MCYLYSSQTLPGTFRTVRLASAVGSVQALKHCLKNIPAEQLTCQPLCIGSSK